MLSADGLLSKSVGILIETGKGRGIGFLLVMAGLLIFSVSIIFYTYLVLKNIKFPSDTVDGFIVTGGEIVEDL
jgi:hypothetical protein